MEMKGTEKKEGRLRGGGDETSTDLVERRIRLGISGVCVVQRARKRPVTHVKQEPGRARQKS